MQNPRLATIGLSIVTGISATCAVYGTLMVWTVGPEALNNMFALAFLWGMTFTSVILALRVRDWN